MDFVQIVMCCGDIIMQNIELRAIVDGLHHIKINVIKVLIYSYSHVITFHIATITWNVKMILHKCTKYIDIHRTMKPQLPCIYIYIM